MQLSCAVNADVCDWGQDKVHWYNKPLTENSNPRQWDLLQAVDLSSGSKNNQTKNTQPTKQKTTVLS